MDASAVPMASVAAARALSAVSVMGGDAARSALSSAANLKPRDIAQIHSQDDGPRMKQEYMNMANRSACRNDRHKMGAVGVLRL